MIRVIIADDHHLIRQGLRDLLSKEPDIRVVAEAADGLDAIDAVRRVRADVIVMDVDMPGINGIDATRKLRASFPEIQVVMLSMHSGPGLIRNALDIGARGYVLKKSTDEELVKAIRTVCGGGHLPIPGHGPRRLLVWGVHPWHTAPAYSPRARNPSTDRIGAIQSPDSGNHANQYKNRAKPSHPSDGETERAQPS